MGWWIINEFCLGAIQIATRYFCNFLKGLYLISVYHFSKKKKLKLNWTLEKLQRISHKPNSPAAACRHVWDFRSDLLSLRMYLLYKYHSYPTQQILI
jgi:hypothetical protein